MFSHTAFLHGAYLASIEHDTMLHLCTHRHHLKLSVTWKHPPFLNEHGLHDSNMLKTIRKTVSNR